jgi:hypothetical protein
MPGRNLQLAVANLALVVEPDDPFGHYRFELIVRDNVSEKTLRLFRSVEVVAKNEE